LLCEATDAEGILARAFYDDVLHRMMCDVALASPATRPNGLESAVEVVPPTVGARLSVYQEGLILGDFVVGAGGVGGWPGRSAARLGGDACPVWVEY
jgi:hypothetical protein